LNGVCWKDKEPKTHQKIRRADLKKEKQKKERVAKAMEKKTTDNKKKLGSRQGRGHKS